MVALSEILASEVALLLSVNTFLSVDLVSTVVFLLVVAVLPSLTPEVDVLLLESETALPVLALLFLAVTVLFLRLSLFPYTTLVPVDLLCP